MTPDLWIVCAKAGDDIPEKPIPDGYHPIGPWEPTAAVQTRMQFVVLWRRPLQKISTSMDSGNILR